MDYKDFSSWLYSGWLSDMISALSDLPKWRRILLRFVMGKYAYREFVGAIEAIRKDGDTYIFDGYCLYEQKYHNDKTPLDWKDVIYKEYKNGE